MGPGDIVARRFEIEAVAGEGGMGVVYRAVDRELGGTVALKVLREGQDNEQFAHEAQLLSHLVHPGIVRCIAFGATADGRHFLATEWLEGETLRQRLARSPALTIGEALSIVRRIAEALAAAHAWGVVHRDVTPANVVLLADGSLKLLDFGIARAGLRPLMTETEGLGTPGYVAPEQARGDGRVDARADVFSLGCVLFECLTGRKAFQGDHAVAVLARVLIEDAPRVRSVRRDVPPAVDALVARMLGRDPASRPADGGAVAARIAELGADLVRMPQPFAALPSRPQIGAFEARVTTVVVASRLDSAQRTEIDARLAGRARIDWLTPTSLVLSVAGEAPRATEQAACAANAARELRRICPSARIAIATGRSRPVVTRAPADWIGDAIGRAVELSRAAPATTHVIVDDPTAGLLADRFGVTRVGDSLALGDNAPAVRTLLGREIPCLGRDREIGVAMSAWEECVEERSARVVLLIGPPGIGKSRIREEVTRRIREVAGLDAIWVARGDPTSLAVPLKMVADLVCAAVGARPEQPPAMRCERLERMVGRTLSPGDAGRVAEFLGEVAFGGEHGAVPSVQLSAARQDPMLMGDQVRLAWESFVTGVLAVHPVVIVLEDVQWADEASVRAVDALLGRARDRPLLVVGVGRPEAKEVFPRLWGSRDPVELALGKLAPHALESVARLGLGDGASAETVRAVVERSSGNPFFLEELVRAVAAGRSNLPESVLAMVQARLDGLEPEARRVLRAASFFGGAVTAEAVAALAGDERGSARVEPWLGWLVERELIVRRDGPTYDFRHRLLRDAAYATLTDEDRSLGHLLAARFLEAQGERDAATLAEHFERGGAHADAARWRLAAASRSLEGSDLAGAIAHAERSLGAICAADAGLAHLLLAEAHRWLGDYTLAGRAADAAMLALAPGSLPWFQAAAEAATSAASAGDSAALGAIGDAVAAQAPSDDTVSVRALARVALQLVAAGDATRADSLLDRIGSVPVSQDAPLTEARVEQALALRARVRADTGEVAERTLRSLAAFERAGDARNACNQRMTLGFALLELGQNDEGKRAIEDGLAVAERMGLASARAVGHHMLAMAALRGGDASRAAELEESVKSFFAEHRSARYEGGASSWLALARLALGDTDRAHEAAVRAVALLVEIPPARALGLAILARVDLARGDVTAALGASEQALELALRPAGVDSGEVLVWLVRVAALERAGRTGEAAVVASRAKARLLARAARISRPDWRQSFLTRVPENAQMLAK